MFYDKASDVERLIFDERAELFGVVSAMDGG
jgi:hypothetical protein